MVGFLLGVTWEGRGVTMLGFLLGVTWEGRGYYVGVSVRCDLGREGVTMLGFLLGVTWEGRGLLCWGFC